MYFEVLLGALRYFWVLWGTSGYFEVRLGTLRQGGRCWGSAGAALHERSGSFTKGRTPNIRYFVAKLGIVEIYALFDRLS